MLRSVFGAARRAEQRRVEVPARRAGGGRRIVGRVDHDVDPDRRLLGLDELRQPGLVGRFAVSRCTVGFGSPMRRRASSRPRGCTACSGWSASNVGLAGETGVQPGCVVPPKTTLFIALRSIASSNACRRAGLDASGVPTFAYGRLPTPFLFPRLIDDAPPAERPFVWSTRRLDVCLDARQLRSARRVERLDVARLQRRRRRGRVGHRLEHDLVEVDGALVVVVGRLDHGDVVAGDAVVEHERADADRIGRRSCRRAWRAASATCTTPSIVASVAVSGVNRVFRWITTVYGPDAVTLSIGCEVAGADRARSVDHALERRDDRLRVERRAVVELDPLPERDRVGELVLRDHRQRGGELGHDPCLAVVVVELLAEGLATSSAARLPCERRVERVGIAAAQADDERAAVLRLRPGQCEGGAIKPRVSDNAQEHEGET